MYNKFKLVINNYSIKKKLRIAFIGIIILMCICIFVTLIGLKSVVNKTNILYKGPYETNNMVWDMEIRLSRIDNYMYKTMIESDEKEIVNNLKAAEQEVKILDQNIEKLRKIFLGKEELINTFEVYLNAFSSYRSKICEALIEGKNEQALSMLKDTYKKILMAHKNACKKYLLYLKKCHMIL